MKGAAATGQGEEVNREGSVTLGLIPAPDIPEKIAEELASELPDLLRSRVDGGSRGTCR
jgi:hypothetical protein